MKPTTTRTTPEVTKPMIRRQSFRAILLVGGAISAISVGLHGVPEAARTTAAAVAEILAAPSGITSTSNFEVGLPPVTETQVVVEVEAEDTETSERLGDALNEARSVSQPATFSVTGEPFQVYSVALPVSSTTTSSTFSSGETAVVVFSDYTHSAGANPTIGLDGKAVFAVGATVEVGPEDALLPLGDDGSELEDGISLTPNGNEGTDDFSQIQETVPVADGDIEDDAEGEPVAIDTQSTGSDGLELGLNNADGELLSTGTNNGAVAAALRQNNPFRFAVDPRFLNVLVSYN